MTPEEMEELAKGAGSEKDITFMDLFNHETLFNYVGLENASWIEIAVFYVMLLIPTYVIVRSALFLILPKSWLKWLFNI